jgi:hypothetical protein
MAPRLSALRPGRLLPPGQFLVLNFVRGWVDPTVIVRLEELDKLKKSTSSGTRTGDLPACIIVPQPTTLPRSELYIPSDRRLSAKLLQTFAGRRCRVVSATDPHGRILGFLGRTRYYSYIQDPTHKIFPSKFYTHKGKGIFDPVLN